MAGEEFSKVDRKTVSPENTLLTTVEKIKAWEKCLTLLYNKYGFEYTLSIEDRNQIYRVNVPHTSVCYSARVLTPNATDATATAAATPISESENVSSSSANSPQLSASQDPNSTDRVIKGAFEPSTTTTTTTCADEQQQYMSAPSSESAENLQHLLATANSGNYTHSQKDSISSSQSSSSSSADTVESLASETSIASSSSTANSISQDDRVAHLAAYTLPPLPETFKTFLRRHSVGKRLIQDGNVVWVETEWQIKIFVEVLSKLDSGVAQLFLDQEGDGMSRNGTLSYLQMTFAHLDTTFVLDCHLGPKLFDTVDTTGLSLRHVLEDAKITKVYFDVRNDSDAIFAHFGIRLRGIKDVQLMEMACRGPIRYTNNIISLARSVRLHLGMWDEEREEWLHAKERGKSYCLNYGGWSAFDVRPLPYILAKYTAQDTECLPHLYATYFNKLKNCPEICSIINKESQKRADDSQLPDYDPNPKSFALTEHLSNPRSFRAPTDNDRLYNEYIRAQLTEYDLEPGLYLHQFASGYDEALEDDSYYAEMPEDPWSKPKPRENTIIGWFKAIKRSILQRYETWKADRAFDKWVKDYNRKVKTGEIVEEWDEIPTPSPSVDDADW